MRKIGQGIRRLILDFIPVTEAVASVRPRKGEVPCPLIFATEPLLSSVDALNYFGGSPNAFPFHRTDAMV